MVEYSDRRRPSGDMTLRTLAMPADANAAGDIFGGGIAEQRFGEAGELGISGYARGAKVQESGGLVIGTMAVAAGIEHDSLCPSKRCGKIRPGLARKPIPAGAWQP